jgi:hypothetical protein
MLPNSSQWCRFAAAALALANLTFAPMAVKHSHPGGDTPHRISEFPRRIASNVDLASNDAGRDRFALESTFAHWHLVWFGIEFTVPGDDLPIAPLVNSDECRILSPIGLTDLPGDDSARSSPIVPPPEFAPEVYPAPPSQFAIQLASLRSPIAALKPLCDGALHRCPGTLLT